MEWAHHVFEAHREAKLAQTSFTPEQIHIADLIAPIFSAGDPTSVVKDLTPIIETNVVQELLESVAAPKGVRFVAVKVRKISEWRHFFKLHAEIEIENKPKLLTHSGHGSVTSLQSDIPLGQRTSAVIAMTKIKWITGAQWLGRHRLTAMQHCPQCGIRAGGKEFLERHVVRCPNGGTRHLLHYGFVNIIKTYLRNGGVPEAAIVLEARELRAADRSRPGDVVALDFFADGRHLVIDAVMTIVYRNKVLKQVA